MSENIAEAPSNEPVGSTEVGDTSHVSEDQILDVGQFADYKVAVKIDGEELRVPISEAIAGYQRQSDYTRKTQELAEQKQALQFAATLQTALENDPATTIDLLSKHYGISRAEATQMAEDMGYQEDLDPADRKLKELDQRIAQFEEYQTQQQIEREINRLKATYEDFDANEVVQAALRTGSTDLEATYKQIAFDKFMKQRNLEAQAQAAKSAEEQRILEAKRNASVVEGGASATAATTTDSVAPITSLADAWMAAKRSLGAEL